MSIIFLYLIACFIGISLTLTSTGGAILAIPSLVYLAHLTPLEAIPISLLVVTIISSIACITHFQQGNVNLRLLLYYLPLSILGSYLGSHLASHLHVADHIHMFIIGVWTLCSSISMFFPHRSEQHSPYISLETKIITGLLIFGITILSGFLGMGGGFVLVPILYYIAQYNLKEVTASVLVMVAMNSLSAFVGYLVDGHVNIHWDIALPFLFFASLGILLGSIIFRNISIPSLKRVFAVIALLIAIFTITMSCFMA